MKFPLILLIPLLISCSTGTKPIDYGKEDCTFCKMTIMEKQFGCQVVNEKGKKFDFDDLSCLIAFLKTEIIPENEIAAIYVPDYSGSHELMPAEGMFFLAGGKIRSPMAGNMAAFANKDSADFYAVSLKGQLITWEKIRGKND